MKSLNLFALTCVFLFSLTILAERNPKLVPLKPLKPAQQKLGRLIATLENKTSGKRIAEFSGDLGDCKTCTRGVSVSKAMGLRIEGGNPQELRVTRKQSQGVRLIACDQDQALGTGFKCEFAIENEELTLSLKFEAI